MENRCLIQKNGFSWDNAPVNGRSYFSKREAQIKTPPSPKEAPFPASLLSWTDSSVQLIIFDQAI